MAEKNKRRRNRRRRGSGNGSEQKVVAGPVRPLYTPVDDPSRTYMPPPPAPRDYEPDPLSGEPIENPVTAIAHPASGKPMNIETVIRVLADQETLGNAQEVAYIGAGSFGVLETKNQNGRAVVEIIKKIPYEDTHEKYPWRRELSPGISRDYTPQPESLDRLYTQDEIQAFPKLGASAAALPRTN